MSAAARVRLSALALLVMLSCPSAPDAQGGLVGTLVALTGTVEIERFRGAEVPELEPGVELYEGDRIVTARASRARIELVDGSILQLGEQTDLELTWVLYAPQEETRNILVGVGLGIVRTVVEAIAPRSWFELRTPTAITSVRGTDWIAEAAPDATAVVSLEGEVAVANVRDDIDEVVVLGPGEGTTVPAGEAPAEVSEWGAPRIASFIARTSLETP